MVAGVVCEGAVGPASVMHVCRLCCPVMSTCWDPKTKSAHLKMALWMRVSPWGSFPIRFSQTCNIFHPELQCMLIAVVHC